jgi:hypothetical protein
MPNPAHQFIVKGERADGVICFWTGSLGGKYPSFLRDRTRAYPMTREGANEIVARFSNSPGLLGFVYSAEPYELRA